VAWRSYQFEDKPVAVRSTSAWFADWLDEALAAYSVAHTEPELYDYSVVAPDPGPAGSRPMNILYGSNTASLTRTVNVMDLGRTVLRVMDAGLLRERTDAIYLDAGLVWRNGSLAVVESNMIGFLLSTGGRRIEKAGLRLGADVVQAIDIDTGMLVPRSPQLDVPADIYDRLAGMKGVPNTFERPLVEKPTIPDVVCTNTWLRGPVRRLTRAQGLARLAEQSLNLPMLGQRGLDALTKTVTASPPCEIQSDEVANAIEGLTMATSGGLPSTPVDPSADSVSSPPRE
jgi:hypothetical protein